MRAGIHYIADIETNNFDQFEIRNTLTNYLLQTGHTILDSKIHFFGSDVAFTLYYLLAESHLSLHTYPEHSLITLDFYTCKKTIDMKDFHLLNRTLFGDKITHQILERG